MISSPLARSGEEEPSLHWQAPGSTSRTSMLRTTGARRSRTAGCTDTERNRYDLEGKERSIDTLNRAVGSHCLFLAACALQIECLRDKTVRCRARAPGQERAELEERAANGKSMWLPPRTISLQYRGAVVHSVRQSLPFLDAHRPS